MNPDPAHEPISPLPRTWWVERGHLLAGCYPGDLRPERARSKIETLLDAGIRTFVCLQPEDETNQRDDPFRPYQDVVRDEAGKRQVKAGCLRFPVPDYQACDPATMRTILDAVDASLNANRPVYLHCWGGHGRTGMTVGCWLVRHGRTPEQAFEELRRGREIDGYLRMTRSPQTPAQRALVRGWKQGQ